MDFKNIAIPTLVIPNLVIPNMVVPNNKLPNILLPDSILHLSTVFLNISINNDTLWENYMIVYHKNYSSEAIEEHARSVFLNNIIEMKNHNNDDNNTYVKGINNFTDMTPEAVSKQLGGAVKTNTSNFLGRKIDFTPVGGLTNKSVDWNKLGYVTPVRNQGQCGSCTAFSVIQAIESQLAIQSGKESLKYLSVQQLLDCTGPDLCNGGNNIRNYEYLMKFGQGIPYDSCYPYTAQNQTCMVKSDNCTACVLKSFVSVIPHGNEDSMAEAMTLHGPLSIEIHFSRNFPYYKGGIFVDDNCWNETTYHAVLLVGYGEDEHGIQYWLIKNSWGAGWGEKGYIRMARNRNNTCGIATDATYPVLL